VARPRPGWKPAKPFQKGVAANPRGKPKGTKDQTPRNVWELLRKRGDRDPLDVLSEYVTSNTVDPALKLQAAGMLASYKHGKRPSYRYIEDVVGLKAPQTLEEAVRYQSKVAELVASGQLDLDGGAAVKDMLQSYADMKVASELETRMAQAEALIQELMARGYGNAARVIGGLPELPGTTIILPAKEPPTPLPGDRPPIDPTSPNPWATPDVGSLLQPKPRRTNKPGAGRPRGAKDSLPRFRRSDELEDPESES
jgi:hypothetical protein